MKVLLTSTGLENEKIRDVFLTNIGKHPQFCKALFVTCAAIDQESKDMVKECYNELLDLHIRPNSIVEYNFDSIMSVDELCQYDLMYICGGDENHLIKKIVAGKMRSNLIEAIRRSLFYIGVSAGACVGSPYVQDGLNFCPNKVDVHYTKDVTPNGKLPPQNVQINLSNGQAVWIKDNTMTIIGTDSSHQSESVDEYAQIESILNRFPNFLRYIEEAKLSADERRCFGLPKKKKYPMPDEAHVRAAIRFFNHCDPEDEEELARNINKYIRKYNMKDVHVGENNRFKKYYKPINEDYLEEGLLPTVTMYHGSYLKLKTLKPFAYNAGTKFRKPSWSVFMWAQWDLAYKWAAFVSLKKAIRTERKELGLELPVGEHYRIGFNHYGYKLYIKYDEFDKIKELAMKYQPKFYVYTVKAPIDTKLGAGNNSMQPEYTYDGELKIYKREEFTLTEEVFDDLFEPVSSIKYAEIRKFEGENIRGPLGWIFRPNDETMKEWIYVTKGVQQGLFKPGDDLDKILDDYYASLEESADINQSNGIQTIPFVMPDHGNGTAGIIQSPITEDTKVKSDQEQFLEIYLFIRACVNSSRQALELLESGGGCMVGMDINHVTVQNYTPGMFIIQYTADDEKKAYAITNDIKSKYIYREYHNRLIKEDYSYLNDKEFKLYKLDNSCIPQWANLLNKVLANKTITSIYEELTNTKLISDSQIKNDSRFEEVIID